MNGNTAELHGWLLEGGGGTVCPIPIAWPIDACRFAGGSHSRAVVSSLTLDRYEGAGANGVSAFAQSRAEHLILSSENHSPQAAPSSFPTSIPHETSFSYASCADISGSGRRSFWSLPLRWGRFAPRKARSCEHIQTRNARREGQRGCFLCRFAGGSRSRASESSLRRAQILCFTAGREEQCFPAEERGTRTAAGGIPIFRTRRGGAFFRL